MKTTQVSFQLKIQLRCTFGWVHRLVKLGFLGLGLHYKYIKGQLEMWVRTPTPQSVKVYKVSSWSNSLNLYRVIFLTGPPKKFKYGKPRLGESTLT